MWNAHLKSQLKSSLHFKACTKFFLCFLEWMFWLSYNIPVGLLSYRKHPLISQQLLTIQEELNNKKSELEQAKEEQSHTQALLKVLQEQVSESHSSDPRISLNTDTHASPCLTHAQTLDDEGLSSKLAWDHPNLPALSWDFNLISSISVLTLVPLRPFKPSSDLWNFLPEDRWILINF